MNNTHDFAVDAHTVCRYIDVDATPGGLGLLIPFATEKEWITGPGGTGFLATSGSRRSFVKLDFCRQTTMQTANFSGAGGVSDPASVVAGQPLTAAYTFEQKRIDTRSDAAFASSLIEVMPGKDFNMRRSDCLGNTTYPDGSVRNPCFTWNWVEQITPTFADNIGINRTTAATAAPAVPIVKLTETWGVTLARTACTGPNAVASDGRAVPGNSCPPAVKKPELRACTPQAHNQRHWQTISTNNVRALNDCGPGYIENPARRYTYDMEAEYWCFDSTDYPTGNQREKNGRTSGVCLPIINGQVGPVNGTGVGTLNGGSPGLCASGTVTNFAEHASGWTWTCKGANTGSDAYGAADRQATLTYTCGAASSELGGSGSVTTNCSKYNNATNTCEGTNPWTGVNNCCKPGGLSTQSFNVNGYTVAGCNAACAQMAETRNTTPCPSGQSGEIVEERTVNSGGVCGSNTGWTVRSNTCVPATCEAANAGLSVTVAIPGKVRSDMNNVSANTGYGGSHLQHFGSACVGESMAEGVMIRAEGTFDMVGNCTASATRTIGTSTYTVYVNADSIVEGMNNDGSERSRVYGSAAVTKTVCAPVCEEKVETRTGTRTVGGYNPDTNTDYQCTMLQRRTINRNNVCNDNGNWEQVSETCDGPPACTATMEERTSTPCPAGQTGTITERRTVNQGDVCGSNSGWTEFSNTCVPGATYNWDVGAWVPGTCTATPSPPPPPVPASGEGRCVGGTLVGWIENCGGNDRMTNCERVSDTGNGYVYTSPVPRSAANSNSFKNWCRAQSGATCLEEKSHELSSDHRAGNQTTGHYLGCFTGATPTPSATAWDRSDSNSTDKGVWGYSRMP